MNLRSALCALVVLSCVVPVAYADVCVAPGDVLLTDPAGDIIGSPVPPDPVTSVADVLSLSVATPMSDSIDDQTLVFTINTAGTAPALPPGSGYYASFLDPRQTVRGVRAEGGQDGALTYFSYVVSADNDGGTDGRFIEDGSQIPAEGSFAGGVITITVKAKDLRIKDDGDALSGFNASSFLLIGSPSVASGSLTVDGMPDDLNRDTPVSVTYSPCKKSGESKAADVSAVEDKSATNFGGAFAPGLLLMLAGIAGLRRRSLAVAALSLVAPFAHADVCVAPGDVVLEDPAGDQAFQEVIPVPGATFYDLVALSVAAPPAAAGEDRKITFTIDLTAQQPTPVLLPGTAIYSSFIDPRQLVRGVRVQATQDGGMEFFSYVAGGGGTDGTIFDGRFVEAGSAKPAEPESSYVGGVATIVIKLKDIRLDEDGGVIQGFNAGTTQAVGANGTNVAAGILDAMPDGLAHANPLEIPKCSGKSADVKTAVEDKSATNFGGAFGLMNLLLVLPMLLRIR
ncbi:MAG: hypothetical protein AABY95_11690 [Pseudomonadota bacterium]